MSTQGRIQGWGWGGTWEGGGVLGVRTPPPPSQKKGKQILKKEKGKSRARASEKGFYVCEQKLILLKN